MASNLRRFLLGAKKAVATATVLESSAVALGLLTGAQEGLVTAVLGAVTTTLVYYLRNTPQSQTLEVAIPASGTQN